MLAVAPAATAHPLAPSLLALEEVAPETYSVTWKTPLRVAAGSGMVPRLPAGCASKTDARWTREGTGAVSRWLVRCPEGLVGSRIAIEGLAPRVGSVVLSIALADGRSFAQLLTAGEPGFDVPERASRTAVFGRYLRLGAEHFAIGADHVLFVLGLLLLVHGGGVLLATITAFTAGHSVTLAWVALGGVAPETARVETWIALTLLLLALEIVPREGRAKLRIFGTRPWAAAFVFGMLHGLGFAGALLDLGLPSGDVPLALFSFNVGIELAQLVLVAAALLGWAIVRRFAKRAPKREIRWVAAYAMGSVAAFWMFDRASAAMFSGP
jgi:hypothetical protein